MCFLERMPPYLREEISSFFSSKDYTLLKLAGGSKKMQDLYTAKIALLNCLFHTINYQIIINDYPEYCLFIMNGIKANLEIFKQLIDEATDVIKIEQGKFASTIMITDAPLGQYPRFNFNIKNEKLEQLLTISPLDLNDFSLEPLAEQCLNSMSAGHH